jgi:hypothetical protein
VVCRPGVRHRSPALMEAGERTPLDGARLGPPGGTTACHKGQRAAAVLLPSDHAGRRERPRREGTLRQELRAQARRSWAASARCHSTAKYPATRSARLLTLPVPRVSTVDVGTCPHRERQQAAPALREPGGPTTPARPAGTRPGTRLPAARAPHSDEAAVGQQQPAQGGSADAGSQNASANPSSLQSPFWVARAPYLGEVPCGPQRRSQGSQRSYTLRPVAAGGSSCSADPPLRGT